MVWSAWWAACNGLKTRGVRFSVVSLVVVGRKGVSNFTAITVIPNGGTFKGRGAGGSIKRACPETNSSWQAGPLETAITQLVLPAATLDSSAVA